MIIGVIVLILGISIVAISATGVLKSLHIVNSFSQQQPGQYVSSEIKLNISSLLVVTSPVSRGGIIPASDLTIVNSTNFGSYAIPYNSTAAGSETYDLPRGDYYYEAFVSTTPQTMIIVTGVSTSHAIEYTLISDTALACIVGGIVIAIVGVALKKKIQVD